MSILWPLSPPDREQNVQQTGPVCAKIAFWLLSVVAVCPGPNKVSARQLDPDKVAAFAPVKSDYLGFKAACPGEKIQVDMVPASLHGGVRAYVVKLSSGGNCFGNMGENSYVVAQVASSWTRLFSGAPGHLAIQGDEVLLNSVGTCKVTWRWTDESYRPHASRDCGGLLHVGPVALEVPASSQRLSSILPLRAGLFVDEKESCSEADSASKLSIHGADINSAHVLSHVLSVRTEGNSYLVSVRNTGTGGVGGEAVRVDVEKYTIGDPSHFSVTSPFGVQAYRWCGR